MKIIRSIIAVCLLSIISIAIFSSCEKFADDTPKAIKELIKRYSKSETILFVEEYECNDEIIYLFSGNPAVNGMSHLIDKDGIILCSYGDYIFDISCQKEYTNRTLIRVIWTCKD